MRSQLLPSPRAAQRLSPRSPPGLRSLRNSGGQSAGGSRGRNASFGPRATAPPADRQVSPSLLTTASVPQLRLPERDPPERDFGTREKRGGLRGVVKPRTSYPYPESTDPDPPPSLRALPAAARPGKGVWALDSHRHSAAASPGSSPEALTAQGAKQEAGINGRTDGRARMSRSWG